MSHFIWQAAADHSLWHSINWTACWHKVKSLQRRIVKAVQAGQWRKVKRLSHLLIHSFSARALAVKRVIENSGKKTPGIDQQIWGNPQAKYEAIWTLKNWQGYRPKPLRRIYIPKKNGKKRPLSIPTMEDRARQALYMQALQPVAETLADGNSYGFRAKRSCADAIDQCFKALRQKTSAEWILEGDIKGFFDNIDFNWLLEHIPMNKNVLNQWLHSGYVEKGQLFATTKGVPQGGIISPILGNWVLDGLENLVRGQGRFSRNHKINFVRYADDFIVTASSEAVLREVIVPKINAFLQQRGVALSEEKTKITHINEGFDFLGQTLRKHNTEKSTGKLHIRPSKESLKKIKAKVSEVCKSSRGLNQEELIKKLNPVLRGWANYHRHSICSDSFAQLDSHVWNRVFRWARRRHPNKTGQWIANRYFIHLPKQSWIFQDKASGKRLIRVAAAIKCKRHIKIKAEANPFDEAWEDYFLQRQQRKALEKTKGLRAKLLKRFNGVCIQCKQMIQPEDALDLHHLNGNHQDNRIENLVLLHPNCHRQVHHSGI